MSKRSKRVKSMLRVICVTVVGAVLYGLMYLSCIVAAIIGRGLGL
jgi:hypothetical protein